MKYYSPGRLNKIFEAIDSGDTMLFWDNRAKWEVKHGYRKTISKRKSPKKQQLESRFIRECLGEYDATHNFCISRCSQRIACQKVVYGELFAGLERML